MIHNESPAIRARLSAIEGVKNVTRGWPKSFERLPCIAVTKASDTPMRFADDKEYVAELEYYVRIFTNRESEADRLAQEVETAMEELGYTRTFSYDDDDAEVRMAALRYRKYV